MDILDGLLQAGLLRRLDVLEQCLIAASLPADNVIKDRLSCEEPIEPILNVTACAVAETGSVQLLHPVLPTDYFHKPITFVVREFWGRLAACSAGFHLCPLKASDQPVVLLDAPSLDASDRRCQARALDEQPRQTVQVMLWKTGGLPLGCFWTKAQADAFARKHGICASSVTVAAARLFPEAEAAAAVAQSGRYWIGRPR